MNGKTCLHASFCPPQSISDEEFKIPFPYLILRHSTHFQNMPF